MHATWQLQLAQKWHSLCLATVLIIECVSLHSILYSSRCLISKGTIEDTGFSSRSCRWCRTCVAESLPLWLWQQRAVEISSLLHLKQHLPNSVGKGLEAKLSSEAFSAPMRPSVNLTHLIILQCLFLWGNGAAL